jgi:hypothetical protein
MKTLQQNVNKSNSAIYKKKISHKKYGLPQPCKTCSIFENQLAIVKNHTDSLKKKNHKNRINYHKKVTKFNIHGSFVKVGIERSVPSLENLKLT